MSTAPRVEGLRRTAGGVAWQMRGQPGRPCVLIIHGAFMSQKAFVDLAQALSTQYCVLLCDLPGHGESQQLSVPRRLQGYVPYLLEVMDQAGQRQVLVLGHSFGGMVAQALIAQAPQRVSAFVAYGCIANHLMRMPLPGLVSALTRLGFRRGSADAFARRFLEQCQINPRDQAWIWPEIQRQSAALRADIWHAMVHGVRWQPDYRLPCPVAHLRGEHDKRFPGAEAGMQRFCATLPPARVQQIAQAGHCAHLDQPEAFLAALLALLAPLTSRPS